MQNIMATISSTDKQIESLLNSSSTSQRETVVIDNVYYFLSKDILYSCDKYEEGAVVVRIAVDGNNRLFVMKSVTVPHLTVDGGSNNRQVAAIRSSLSNEISNAYKYNKVPHKALLEKKIDQYTEFSFILYYQGYNASMLINSDDNIENISSLTSWQYADISLQFIERVFEIHHDQKIHRDVRLENFVVELFEDKLPCVSIIDFASIRDLKNHFEDNKLGYYKSKKIINRPENVPAVYHQQRTLDTVYYESIATELYAALVSSEKAYKRMLLTLLSELQIPDVNLWRNRVNELFSLTLVDSSLNNFEEIFSKISVEKKELYQELGNFIFTQKRHIDNSRMLYNGMYHPTLSEIDIASIEKSLLNLRKLCLKILIEYSLLKKHAFNIAQKIYLGMHSPATYDAQNAFTERLLQDSEYQAIEYDFKSKFPEKSHQLSPEIILDQHNMSRLDIIDRCRNIFSETVFVYNLVSLKIKLKELKQIIPSNILKKIEGINAESDKNVVLDVSRKIYDFLEQRNAIEASDFESWYACNMISDELCSECFEPKEIARSAAAIVCIYNEYINLPIVAQVLFQEESFQISDYLSAVQFFQSRENYNLAKKIYIYFNFHQSRFEDYYVSTNSYYEKWCNVFVEETCLRILSTLEIGALTLGRVYNDAPIVNVLQPWKFKCISNGLLEVCRTQGKEGKDFYLTQQYINKEFLKCIWLIFFKDQELFNNLFSKLAAYFFNRSENSSPDEYNNFLSDVFNMGSGNEPKKSNSLEFYKNSIAIRLVFSLLFNSMPTVSVCAAKTLAQWVILPSFSTTLSLLPADFFLSCFSSFSETGSVLNGVVLPEETVIHSFISPSRARVSQEEFIKNNTCAVYSISSDNPSMHMLIRKTFPCYRCEDDFLDFEEIHAKAESFYTTDLDFFATSFFPHLIKVSREDFYTTYYTWVRLLVHPVEPGQFGYMPKTKSMLMNYAKFDSSHHLFYLENYYLQGQYLWQDGMIFSKKNQLPAKKKILNESQFLSLQEKAVEVLKFWWANRYPCATPKEILLITCFLSVVSDRSHVDEKNPFISLFLNIEFSDTPVCNGATFRESFLRVWPSLLHNFLVAHERNKCDIDNPSENDIRLRSILKKNDIIINKIFNFINLSQSLSGLYCSYLANVLSMSSIERGFLENFMSLHKNSAAQSNNLPNVVANSGIDVGCYDKRTCSLLNNGASGFFTCASSIDSESAVMSKK